MEEKTYYAHISEDGRMQTVKEHLRGTAELCEKFASEFGAQEHAYIAGIAHDIGKYGEGFQRRLHGGPRVDHSSAGALECAIIGQDLPGMCVAGHHAGLPDYGNQADMPGDDTFVGRMKSAYNTRKKSYPGWEDELPKVPPPPEFKGNNYVCSFWVRMLYSCLVDADYLDTEAFMKNREVERGGFDTIETLKNRLTDFTKGWNGAASELNEWRNRVRDDCIHAAGEAKGLFSLTVPTGGGKTISSLAFALYHAQKHGMKRIIYIIPYTSIIEQNAEVFRGIVGEKNIVEHHSEAQHNYDENLTEAEKRAALAAENWDAPVIVTTAVQFFESLYSNKPSKCRKLHNIANSVLIFDEAQNIPVEQLLPCMAAIGTLVKYFGASAVLCSATQPFVTDLLGKYAPGISVREICSDVDGVFNALKRVCYQNIGRLSVEDIAKRLQKERQVLCIVNTRKAAKELYGLLGEKGAYHLSTLMIPEHRKKTLEEIKKRLSQDLECRVVSTSLIEAGVDIDFPSVYREMTGLDSIVQAAGRCNREGRRTANESVVSIFTMEGAAPRMLKINIGAAREVLGDENAPGDKKTIDRYFRAYRSLIGSENIDKSNAVNHLERGIAGCQLPFKRVSESFQLIDQSTKTVYVETGSNASLIERIKNGTANKTDYRKAGRFSVNIYESHYAALLNAGDIEEITPGAAILVNRCQYNPKTGLSLIADIGRAEFI